MTQTKKLPLVQELERIFSHLNRGLFDSRLRLPTHIIQPEKKVVFRFVPDSYHILIGSEFADLKNWERPKRGKCRGVKRTAIEIMLQEYLHEMCHVYNFATDEIDCTSNQYHNKNFRGVALNAGFYVLKHKTQGCSITKFDLPVATSPTGLRVVDNKTCWAPISAARKKLTSVLESLRVSEEVISNSRTEIRGLISANGPRKVCFLKYECNCPLPHNSVRSGRRPDGDNAPHIRCEDCGALFKCVDA